MLGAILSNSVIPTQCTYSGVGPSAIKADITRRYDFDSKSFVVRTRFQLFFQINLESVTFRRNEREDQKNAWNNFVESIRSKLTVKQVVDSVRGGGDLTFDYILLVLTAE